MHTYWKRALNVALLTGPLLALVGSIEVEARPGGGGAAVRAPRANIGGGPNNVNQRDVNVNRNVNVDVDRHWGYGAVGAGAAVAVGTAIAVGAVVSTLPPSCNTIVADGVTYQNCGGTYYVPRYDGPNVVYEVVAPPSGWNQ